MRQFANKIADVIADSQLRLNVISKTSGVSHTYLTKLVNGRINRPGKDKIASIMLALNHSVGEINAVLADYDYRTLNRLDIPEILKNNQRRKIEGHTLAVYDHIYLELLLSSMERLGGTKILVKNRPSALFMPDDLYLEHEYPFETDGEARTFLAEFTLAVLTERKMLFLSNCQAGHRFETYICPQCLRDYLANNLAEASRERIEGHRQLVVQYFANAIAAMRRNPAQHRMLMAERCPYFNFQIQDADGTHPKVSFPGRKPHDFKSAHDQMNLDGFTSDAPAMIATFQKEVALCRQAVVPAVNQPYPDGVIDYIRHQFAGYGLSQALDSAVADLMERDGLSFF